MKKGTIILIVIIAILVIIIGSGIGTYNSIVDLSEKVSQKESDIDVQLQRRAELIPNLVSTVKGYVKHEDEVIDKITTARQNLVNANSTEDKLKADEELSSALNALFVVVENYPDLKASTNFINLQDELAGTENRIAVARKEYNNSVSDYNKKIKKFPDNIIASMFNYKEKSYLQVTEDKKEVPEVNFD